MTNTVVCSDKANSLAYLGDPIRPADAAQVIRAELVGDDTIAAGELDRPTYTDPEKAAIEAGQAAWRRLASDPTWEDWKKVGQAHVIGRTKAMREAHVNRPIGRRYSAAFATWQKECGFETDKGDRARLFEVMGRLGEIEEWRRKLTAPERLRLNHPTSVLRKWKDAVSEPNRPPQTSPIAKLKLSVTSLEEQNARLRREVERGGGDLWAAEDRPQDIARVIVAKLSKSKAEIVARAILKQLKTK
jgi:hypothetical protein